MDLKRYRSVDMELLHPICKQAFKSLAAELAAAFVDEATRSLFIPFEVYRHPARQNWIQETSKNTQARAFQSPHQFGLAVDFVAYDNTTAKWSWDANEDWEFLKACAEKHGLTVPISWDRVHVEHPRWNWVRDDLKSHGRAAGAPRMTQADIDGFLPPKTV